jgi:hypothetical protein
MGNDKRTPKKVGFWYKTGKSWNHFWSGVDNESWRERNYIESSAKEEILNYMFMKDLRKLIDEFNLSDPEEKEDPQSGTIIKERKTLQEFRRYIKDNVALIDLENYIDRDKSLESIAAMKTIRSSEVATYAGFVASLRQEIHWTLINILKDLASEDPSEFETETYIDYWLEQISQNINRFQDSLSQVRGYKSWTVKLGFDPRIFSNLLEISGKCVSTYQHLYTTIKSGQYYGSNLASFSKQFDELDDELLAEFRNIRRYGFGKELKDRPRNKMSIMIELRGRINDHFLIRFRMRLLDQDEKSLEQISKECDSSDSLVSNIAALATLIDEMNVEGLKSKVKNLPKDGSINILEQFLNENAPDYDVNIIHNLRTIKVLRNQWPIHKTSPKGVELIKKVYGSYPVDDIKEFWSRILNLYVGSLRGLEVTFAA